MPAFVAEHYVAWVQRSLNRFLGESLLTNGIENRAYYDQVKIWQWLNGMKQNGIVDAILQNTLIRANHVDAGYGGWVRRALIATGVDTALPTMGSIDAKVQEAIKSFQAYRGLRDDGWVGYYTETQLIEHSKIDPPGTRRRPTPPKKPKPPPKTRVDPKHEASVLLKMLSLSIYYRTDLAAGVFPDPVERKQMRCLTSKLAHPTGIDFSYFTQRTVLSFCNEKGSNSFAGGGLPSDVASDLREDLLGRVRFNLHLTYQQQVEKYQEILLRAYRDVLLGIAQILAEYGIDGDLGGGAHYLHRFLGDHYKRPSTILHCFRGE